MIRAVLFDLGGTLHTKSFSPERDLWVSEGIARRLGEHGMILPVSAEELARQIKEGMKAYNRFAAESLTELPSSRIWAKYIFAPYGVEESCLEPFAEELSFLYDCGRPNAMPRPALRETMETLRSMGLRLGVISNIISKTAVRHYLEEYEISGYMDCVITSAQTGIRKPDVRIFRIAEKAMGMPPEQLAYVGDTISRDVIGTRRAGWELSIRIENAESAPRDAGFESCGYEPDAAVRRLDEIPPIVEAYNRNQA
ncbi:MAG: HAD family hydrolase [Lachnospiraceae bacterium]|nr:HAD family hydrolase [Lachnospiraceae bacterium]